jgi:hypothetical protein
VNRLEQAFHLIDLWYSFKTPPIEKIKVVYQDQVCLTVSWQETLGENYQVKGIKSGDEWILNRV